MPILTLTIVDRSLNFIFITDAHNNDDDHRERRSQHVADNLLYTKMIPRNRRNITIDQKRFTPGNYITVFFIDRTRFRLNGRSVTTP